MRRKLDSVREGRDITRERNHVCLFVFVSQEHGDVNVESCGWKP